MQKINNVKGSFFGLIVILTLVAAPTLQAQEYGSYETENTGKIMGQQGSAQEFNQRTLETYVEASQNVQEVAQQYQEKLTNAQAPEQMQQIQQEASRQMTRAVRETGMEVPEYNEISQQLRDDPELYEKVVEIQNS